MTCPGVRRQRQFRLIADRHIHIDDGIDDRLNDKAVFVIRRARYVHRQAIKGQVTFAVINWLNRGFIREAGDLPVAAVKLHLVVGSLYFSAVCHVNGGSDGGRAGIFGVSQYRGSTNFK